MAEKLSKEEKKAIKKQRKFERWFKFMRFIHFCVILPFYPYKRYGMKKRYNDTPFIIVGNHLSVLDVIPAAMTTNKPIHYMAKKELFVKGVSKWFTKKCECIPVSRDGSDVRAMMQAMKYLKNDGVVCIFPEGTRNKTDDLFLPFKSGAAALSIKTKTPILPVVQITKIKAFKKSHIFFGEPFEFTEFYDKKLTQEDIERADQMLRDKFEELYYIMRDLRKSKKKK